MFDSEQKQEERRKDAGKHRAIHHREADSESQSPENDNKPCQQDKVSRLRLLPTQGKMPHEGTHKIGGKDEEPYTGTDSQREQMEQPGKGKETPKLCKGMD